jgi:hypothetical protein
MSLKTSEVYRCLEKKTLVFGFEIVDLFLVFSMLAILNLLFGGLPYKFCWTWLPSILLGIGLRIGKTGKPDNYFLHLARFQIAPGVLSGFPLATARQQFRKKIGRK